MQLSYYLFAALLLGSTTAATAQTKPRAPAATNDAESAQGRRLFIRCAACHALAPSPQAKIGPHLQKIIGRNAAGIPGFNYSGAMRKSGLVWNEATLDRWLQKPQAVVPGTTMAFAGMPNPADRKALIAFLRRPN